MKVKTWAKPHEQFSKLGKHSWSVPRLFELSRDLPVMTVPLEHLYMYYTYPDMTLLDMVMHMRAVEAADLSYPVILDEDGELMDGRHRLMKAILLGKKTIKVVRFIETPPPCRVED